MAEETALWTWRSLSEGRSLVEITQEHLDRIRTLTVVWNEAESGAAVLADADFMEIEDLEDDDLGAALEVFMTTAKLSSFEGVIRNPYALAGEDDRYGLDNTPSREIAELILSGQDIKYHAEADEITLWENADRRSYGINPKRPFGSESVSRDVRALIDPQKALSNAAFAKRRKWLESRLLLLLQFFVQNATLPLGPWRRGEDWVWRQVGPDDPPYGESLTHAQWVDRMYLQNHYENVAYTETIHALIHLVWNNRLSGSYAELVRQFKLDNHFDSRGDAHYEGSVEERLRAALQAFPERKGTGPIPWFTLSYARILNSQARFEEACTVLQAAGLFDIDRDELNASTVNTTIIAWAEGLIARHGSGLMSEDEFRAILFGRHSQWYIQPQLWDFVWAMHYKSADYENGAESPGVAHARALAAQLELLRGSYNPDEELKRF